MLRLFNMQTIPHFFFLKTTHDLKNAIESIELFGRIAGIELNLTKCEGLWIGYYKHR